MCRAYFAVAKTVSAPLARGDVVVAERDVPAFNGIRPSSACGGAVQVYCRVQDRAGVVGSVVTWLWTNVGPGLGRDRVDDLGGVERCGSNPCSTRCVWRCPRSGMRSPPSEFG